MLVVGTNSYVTLNEANEYIDTHYGDTNDLACYWRVLGDTSQERWLLKSIQQLENVVLTGIKEKQDQPLAFPRVRCYKEFTVPQEVKDAQVENALGLFKKELSGVSTKQLKTLNTLGVIKNWRKDENILTESTKLNTNYVESDVAQRLLKSWLGGINK